jgi:hypothetical protein
VALTETAYAKINLAPVLRQAAPALDHAEYRARVG